MLHETCSLMPLTTFGMPNINYTSFIKPLIQNFLSASIFYQKHFCALLLHIFHIRITELPCRLGILFSSNVHFKKYSNIYLRLRTRSALKESYSGYIFLLFISLLIVRNNFCYTISFMMSQVLYVLLCPLNYIVHYL